MALGPIELNMMVGRAQDVSAIKQNEDLRPMTEQTAFQNQMEKAEKEQLLNLLHKRIHDYQFINKLKTSYIENLTGKFSSQVSFAICIRSTSLTSPRSALLSGFSYMNLHMNVFSFLLSK